MLTAEDKAKIRGWYMEGTSAEKIAVLSGKSVSSIRQLITKEGWRKEKSTIKQLPRIIDESVKDEIVNKVVKSASALATARVQAHLETILKASGSAMDKLVKNLDQEMHLPPILEHQSAETAVRTLARLDDMARRAMGLPDSVAAVDVTSGGGSLHENAMSILESCKRLVADGKVNAQTLDVHQLRLEMESDSKANG